ncbi:hypothetical protein HYPDE_35448 [Hyphomicrobium denitrificans 1NES1]|uniref:Uncharacterized protein n=1 Tax=Hyphomicrobium denitrificans 1NES1 TaxID=670307 RepID=N0BE22_9HYPH|nr:hypothetical protein HYPDE_35448 [Hyphomicrobium denitrificans 1NES1]
MAGGQNDATRAAAVCSDDRVSSVTAGAGLAASPVVDGAYSVVVPGPSPHVQSSRKCWMGRMGRGPKLMMRRRELAQKQELALSFISPFRGGEIRYDSHFEKPC